MALSPAFSPSCSLSLHKLFLKGLDIQPCLQFGKPGAFTKSSNVKLRHHPQLGVLKTQELEDSALVDVQESSDGYVLFNFGAAQLYDNPPMLISSTVVAGGEVIDCTALVYRMPEETALVSPFRWDFHAHWDYCAHEDAMVPPLKLPMTTFIPGKSIGLPMNVIQSHRSGNLAHHLIEDVQFGNESIVDFLQIPRSEAEMVKLLPTNNTLEDGNPQCINFSVEAVQSVKPSTVRRSEKIGKKARSRHKKPTRNLYRSSSFQVYELIFSYPYMDINKASVTWKAIPKEKYAELFDVLNQIAVGLAGSGLAIMLFVASRMLCLNATLDSTKFLSLLRGVGLLWISSAVQKFGAVVRCMADLNGKGRPERKEHLAMLRKEVHSFTFKVCTVVLLSMVRLV